MKKSNFLVLLVRGAKLDIFFDYALLLRKMNMLNPFKQLRLMCF